MTELSSGHRLQSNLKAPEADGLPRPIIPQEDWGVSLERLTLPLEVAGVALKAITEGDTAPSLRVEPLPAHAMSSPTHINPFAFTSSRVLFSRPPAAAEIGSIRPPLSAAEGPGEGKTPNNDLLKAIMREKAAQLRVDYAIRFSPETWIGAQVVEGLRNGRFNQAPVVTQRPVATGDTERSLGRHRRPPRHEKMARMIGWVAGLLSRQSSAEPHGGVGVRLA